MTSRSRIEPEILKGTRDVLPEEMAKMQFVIGQIRSVFARFGYDAIDTPSLEYAKTLTDQYGEEGQKLMYAFEDHGGRQIALRYDQTVPFARFVASYYRDLPMPFKRYQIGRVWRAEKPAKGRLREFHQCDVDIIGTDSMLAEGEMAGVMCRVFDALGCEQYEIKFNSRRLMNSVMENLSISASLHAPALRVLDKVGKNGEEAVAKDLKTLLGVKSADALVKTLSIKGTNREILNHLKPFAIKEIKQLLDITGAMGLSQDRLVFAPRLARGLDYYTGLVFEAFIPGTEVGAVCSGGRYDHLCARFSDQKFSGVGVAFGLERLIMAMESLQLLKSVKLNTNVLVAYFGEETLSTSLEMVRELQTAGVNAEHYVQPDALGRQIKYADRKGIPFVVICGPDEAARREATIKVMKTGKQKKIPRSQLTTYLNGYMS